MPTVASSQAGKRQRELRKNDGRRREYAHRRDEYRAGRPTKFPAGSYFLTTIYGARTDTVDPKPP